MGTHLYVELHLYVTFKLSTFRTQALPDMVTTVAPVPSSLAHSMDSLIFIEWIPY